MGCYQETDKKKKSKENEALKPNTKITENHSKISTKLDQIPEEKNENDIKASEEEKKDELNNGEERINEEIKIEQNKEEEENKDNLKNKNFYPERNIDSVINEKEGEGNKNENDRENNNTSEQKKDEEEKVKVIEPTEEKKEILKDFTNTRTFYGHSEKVTAITQLNSGKIATGSYDNTIRIWDLNDKEKTSEDKIIRENGRIFTLLEFKENKL